MIRLVSITVAGVVHLWVPFVFAQQSAQRLAPSAPDVAVLQGLDKITARVTTIYAPIGQAVRFGTLDITVRKCHRRPPTETPETTVYLKSGNAVWVRMRSTCSRLDVRVQPGSVVDGAPGLRCLGRGLQKASSSG